MRWALALVLAAVSGCTTPPDNVKLSTCVVGGGCLTLTYQQLQAAADAAYQAGKDAGHDDGETSCSIRASDWLRYFAL